MSMCRYDQFPRFGLFFARGVKAMGLASHIVALAAMLPCRHADWDQRRPGVSQVRSGGPNRPRGANVADVRPWLEQKQPALPAWRPAGSAPQCGKPAPGGLSHGLSLREPAAGTAGRG